MKKIISLLLVVFSYSKKYLKIIKKVLVEYITTKNYAPLRRCIFLCLN